MRLNAIVKGRRGVTADTALKLAELTGTSAESWLNLQARFDIWRAQRAREKRGDGKIRPLRRRETAAAGA